MNVLKDVMLEILVYLFAIAAGLLVLAGLGWVIY